MDHNMQKHSQPLSGQGIHLKQQQSNWTLNLFNLGETENGASEKTL